MWFFQMAPIPLLSVSICSTRCQYDVLKVSSKKIEWKVSIGGVKVDIFVVWDRKWAWFLDFCRFLSSEYSLLYGNNTLFTLYWYIHMIMQLNYPFCKKSPVYYHFILNHYCCHCQYRPQNGLSPTLSRYCQHSNQIQAHICPPVPQYYHPLKS